MSVPFFDAGRICDRANYSLVLEKISEKELVKKCLSGDEDAVCEDAVCEDAWEELYKRYYNLVKSVVSFPRFGFSFDSYQDHIQDIFLEIVKALKNFKFDCKLSTFIAKIAQNRCVSILRAQLSQKRPQNEVLIPLEETRTSGAPHHAVQGGGAAIQIASKNDNPSDIILKEEEKKQIKKALSKLKEECKKVLFLRFFADKSYQEIADTLKLPLGTVCIQVRRCLLNLRKVYLTFND